jgi:VWFA-related protein
MSAKPYVPATAVSLRAETDLVEVGVVVRSRDGHAIPGLTRESFAVTDKGQRRQISYFAVEKRSAPVDASVNATNAAPGSLVGAAVANRTRDPRFIALYFEDFATGAGDLKHAQQAGGRFIKEGLDAGDNVAIFSTSGNFLDYTSDRAKLIEAIDKLKPHPKYNEAGAGCPRINSYEAYQIAVLNDAQVMDAAKAEAATCASDDGSEQYTGMTSSQRTGAENHIRAQAELAWGQVRVASQTTLDAIGKALESLRKAPGPRLLLIASSGFNSGTLEVERDRLIDLALRAGIVINAVDAKGLYAEALARGLNDSVDNVGPIPVQTFRVEAEGLNGKLFTANQAMSDLTQATGGLFFHNNNDLPFGFRQLGSIPEVSYVLGFNRLDAADGKYHKLKVSLVDTKPYVVQARPGYFAMASTPDAGKTVGPAARETMDREVAGTSVVQDFPAVVAYRLENSPQKGMMTVKTQIHVAFDGLKFPARDERRVQKFEFVAALLDASGNVVAGKEGTMDFALTDATYAKLSASGINAGLNLDVPPGKYRLRAVAREAVEGKMASSTLDVEVK